MGEMWGADVAALRRLASALKSGGERCDRATREIEAATARAGWTGPDAARFRQEWACAHRAALTRTGGILVGVGRELERQSDEQERASDSTALGRMSGTTASRIRDDRGVKRLPDPANRDGLVPVEPGISLSDDQFSNDHVAQNSQRNCGLVAVLGELAAFDSQYLQDHIQQVDATTFEVTLYDEDANPVTYLIATVGPDGVRGPDGAQNWATIYQEALIRHGILNPDGSYNAYPEEWFQAITGAPGADLMGRDEDFPTFEQVQQLAADGTPLVLGTNLTPISPDLVEFHAYMVHSVNPDGSVVLVNPWGPNADYGSGDGDHYITITEADYEEHFISAAIAADRDEWIEA